MNNERVSSRQISTLAFFLIRSLFLLFAIPSLLSLSQNDGLIAIVLGTVIGIIPLLMFLSIQNHKKKLNLFQQFNSMFPKYVAFSINSILVLGILLLSVFLTFNIATYVHYSLIPNISILVITITFLLLAITIALKGIESICRSSEIFFFMFIFLFFISLLGLCSYINLNNIRPFFSHSASSIIKSAILVAGFSTGPLFLLTIIPQNSIVEKEHHIRNMIYSYLFSTIIIWIFYFLTISILGNSLASTYQYPTTIVLKKVTFLKIIERLESVLSVHWLFDLIILLSFMLLSLKEGIKEMFHMNDEKKIKKSMVLIFIVIAIGSNYIPHQSNYYIWLFFVVCFGIPSLLWIRQKLKK